MIEQLTEVHTEPQVWSCTSISGELHTSELSLYFLMLYDRRVDGKCCEK